jgi:hypothetical protein
MSYRIATLESLPLDDLLDLRVALTEVIDRHGKMPEDDTERELVERWQGLAEDIDVVSSLD